jgi:putative tricarboxylic transport membrane protein
VTTEGRPRARRQGSRGLTRLAFLALAGLAAAVLWQSGLFRPAEWWADPGNSARLVPGLALLALSVAALALALFGDGETLPPLAPRRLAAGLAALAGLAVFVQAFRLIGWAPAAALLLVALPMLLGFRRLLPLGLFAALLIALVWLVFVRGMGVQLPTGTLWR